MALTGKQIQLIRTLTELTNASKLTWEKHNTPTSFIYRSQTVNYIVDHWSSTVEEMNSECSELVIEKEGIVTEDLVYCYQTPFIDDYSYVNGLYQAVKDRYTTNSDTDIDKYLSLLPH